MSDTIIRCRWVPLKDRLPAESEWVLLAYDGTAPNGLHGDCVVETHVEVCYRENVPHTNGRAYRWLIAANTSAQFVNSIPPTHWMALPPAPVGTQPDIVCRKA